MIKQKHVHSSIIEDLQEHSNTLALWRPPKIIVHPMLKQPNNNPDQEEICSNNTPHVHRKRPEKYPSRLDILQWNYYGKARREVRLSEIHNFSPILGYSNVPNSCINGLKYISLQTPLQPKRKIEGKHNSYVYIWNQKDRS